MERDRKREKEQGAVRERKQKKKDTLTFSRSTVEAAKPQEAKQARATKHEPSVIIERERTHEGREEQKREQVR